MLDWTTTAHQPQRQPTATALMAWLIILWADSVQGCFPLMQSPSACSVPPCSPSQYMMPSSYSSPYYPPSVPAYAQQPYFASKSRSMSPASSPSLDSSVQCARRFADTHLNCALSFEHKTPSDEQECQRLCAEAAPRCRSFEYDPSGSVCSLFEHQLGPVQQDEDYSQVTANSFSEGSNDAREWGPSSGRETSDARWGHRHLRRKRFFLSNGVPMDGLSQHQMASGAAQRAQQPLQLAGVGMAPFSPTSPLSGNCVPSLESRPGHVFVGIDSTACPSADASSLEDDDSSLLTAGLPPPLPSPTSSTPPYSARIFTSTLGSVEPMSAKPSNRREPARAAGSVEVQEMPLLQWAATTAATSGDCSDGSRARVQLVDGIALSGHSPVGRVQLDSADGCLQYLDGRHLSSPCRAATFHRQSGRCELMAEAISPNGPLQYVPNPDSLYFEKICIPGNELNAGCDDIVHRIPQHRLDPNKTPQGATVQTAQSQVDCLRKCIAAKSRHGFACVSASYFFDWPSQNCYLSRFTRLSRPDLYSAERRELVDYLEMPPCFQVPPGGQRQRDSPSSSTSTAPSGWSACIGGTRWRQKANCTATGAECMESEKCGNGAKGATKAIAPSIEVAKRFRPPAGESDEASLFGEQDYEHQKEISFFGPPHQEQTSNAVSESAEKVCDPLLECCPANGDTPKGLVRGCSLGIRTTPNGQTVSCVPNECQ